ncbi:hypothetical protein PLICRDRAFT_167201 [Plicaturopsis crispa FD-325 SS-3]|uniref:Aminotransferase class I/classII large domain-containing protein n=1 Tax=Plicaturopsis crispa FD-325 SS-3 TaxID=944288 RepID=A0A0C9T669_PLICR|nr:hypothetical protein PLICRDRAFT_167201 [Plicaturopsis crispa FD-325 SS-3]
MGSLHPAEKPKAIDLSHHLNNLSRSRHPSPLKDILKYMVQPGMISLAGGLPHPSLFPFESLHTRAYAPDSNLAPGETKHGVVDIHIPQTSASTSNIAIALQYGPGTGCSPNLVSFLREFTARVMQPAYADYEILIHSGNTDGWNKIVNLLCEFGDYILVEAHTYPSAQALWAPMGCKGAPIAMDGDGLLVEDLRRVLANWETDHPGVRRPKLLYVVPVGQNPTGSTMTFERKQAVYALCVEYDIIICEDDPYYFLQLPAYAPPASRKQESQQDEQALLASLVPSFLNLDYQGRVIRLETFSKTLGPGNRLGYFVCNPIFAERLLRATEVTTQTPSGWSQAILAELLSAWGQSGYLTWLRNLRDSYAIRRDWMCDLLAERFDLENSPVPTEGVLAFAKGHGSRADRKQLFSFVQPKAGMFLWLKLNLIGNPEYERLRAAAGPNVEAQWNEAFWMQMIEAKVLLTPGSYYTPWEGRDPSPNRRKEEGVTYFRLTFAFESHEEMRLGIDRMARTFELSWNLVA